MSRYITVFISLNLNFVYDKSTVTRHLPDFMLNVSVIYRIGILLYFWSHHLTFKPSAKTKGPPNGHCVSRNVCFTTRRNAVTEQEAVTLTTPCAPLYYTSVTNPSAVFIKIITLHVTLLWALINCSTFYSDNSQQGLFPCYIIPPTELCFHVVWYVSYQYHSDICQTRGNLYICHFIKELNPSSIDFVVFLVKTMPWHIFVFCWVNINSRLT